jgi:hypothetical protein
MMHERGSALFLVQVFVLVVAAVSLALVMTTSTDMKSASAFRRGAEVRYAAEAGAHRAIADLTGVSDWSSVLDGSVRSTFVDGAPSGSRRLSDGTTVNLDLVVSRAECGRPPPCTDADRATVTRDRPWGQDNPRWRPYAYGPLASLLPSGSASASSYLVVLVGDDGMERDGDPSVDASLPDAGAGVIRLRAEAFGPAGAHSGIDAVVARSSGSTPAVRVIAWRAW